MTCRYLLQFSLSVALVVGGIAAFNVYVDPHGLFRESTEESLSRIDQFFHMRTTRPVQVARNRPDAVVIGSSIAGRMKPQSSAWEGLTANNLSLPGVTLFEIDAMVKHAHNTNALQSLVIGLDATGFVLLGTGQQEGLDLAALELGQQGLAGLQREMARLSLYLRLLTSFPSLKISLEAARGPTQEYATYSPDGSWYREGPDSILGTSGLETITQTQAAFIRLGGGAHLDSNMEQFSRLLQYCYDNGIDTHIYLTPNHALFLQLFEALDLMQVWQDWHRRMVDENLRLATARGVAAFPLWGFNDSEGVIDEPVAAGRPPADSGFQDGVHFRPHLGEIMLADMLERPGTPLLGTRLTPSNLEQYLRNALSLKASYEQDNPDQVQAIRRQLAPRKRRQPVE